MGARKVGKSPCRFEGCERGTRALGLCQTHYIQQWNGKPLTPIKKLPPYEVRFWSRVDKSGECWEWTGGTVGRPGYGVFFYEGKEWRAHRLAYLWERGHIPEGLVIDHMCWNTLCVNPKHLRAITDAQNMQNRPGPYVTSKSGVRGVHWDKDRKRWRVQIGLDKKVHHVGLFETIEEANRAAIEWRKARMPYSESDRRAA